MLEQGHLQKVTAICAHLLRSVHCILYHPNAPLGHPKKAQTIRAERTTMLHTLLTLEAGGDTFTWVVNVYGILGIHHLYASQEASFHPEAN
jgi:hypothetical protein